MSKGYFSGSSPFNLSKDDWIAIGKGAGLAAGGAALVFAISKLTPALDQSTTTGAALAAILAVVLNIARKWVTDTREP